MVEAMHSLELDSGQVCREYPLQQMSPPVQEGMQQRLNEAGGDAYAASDQFNQELAKLRCGGACMLRAAIHAEQPHGQGFAGLITVCWPSIYRNPREGQDILDVCDEVHGSAKSAFDDFTG